MPTETDKSRSAEVTSGDFVPTVKFCEACQKLLLTALSLEEIKRKACRSCKAKLTRAERVLERQQSGETDSDGFKAIK